MGFVKKTGGYLMLVSFVLYGGCDHFLEKYLKEEYSSRAIRLRQRAVRIIEAGAARAVDSVENEMSELEKNLEEGEKDDRTKE